ncbi:MAG TPA: glycoside hydrolase family 36 protein [Anaerolineae bacterium]|nr:glycoside hydrolase family 36 protein [Anaerolineae bacterium]
MKAEDRGHTTLASRALHFSFNPDTSRFSLGLPDASPFVHNAVALTRFVDRALSTAALRVATADQQSIKDVHGAGRRLIIEFEPEPGMQLTLHASLYAAHPFLALKLIVTNRSTETLHLRQLIPLHVAPREGGAIQLADSRAPLSFFKNGYQSWSYTGIRYPDQRDINTRLGSFTRPLHLNPTTPISRERGVFQSEMFGALIDRTARKAIVAGQISAADQFARIGADTRRGQAALTLVCDLDNIPLEPGQSAASEEMLLYLIDLPADDPFADYFDAVARQMNPRVPALPDAGWCSWYYYFPHVREEDVIANLQSAHALRPDLPIDLIQIDDGYQTKTGDWLSINNKFPHGMSWLAEQIRMAGHTPGLWLAPFITVKSAQVATQHPDWLIRDERQRPVLSGKNWNDACYGLDMTHPGAQDYVQRVIDTVVHEWGHPYLKLDFLYAAAAPGLRHDRKTTRAQALRRGLQLIRQTAGDEVFLLGCGCPLGPAIGLVDAMRIGPDIAAEPGPSWTPRYKGITPVFKHEAGFPAGRNAVRNVLNRSGMHRKWWLNDPDCLIVRPARHMPEIEVRAWASVVGLSGGLLITSDDLPTLPLSRRRYIDALLPPLGDQALPLDLFEREMPELYVLRQTGGWRSGVVAGVFNWDDRPRRKRIDLAQLGLDASQPHHTFEFWSSAYRRIEHGHVDLGELPAHGCAVIAVRPVLDRPHLVATTFHLTMGGEVELFETRDSRLIIGVHLKRRAAGEIWIAGGKVREARCNGQPIGIKQPAPGVWALPIEIAGSAQIEVL